MYNSDQRPAVGVRGEPVFWTSHEHFSKEPSPATLSTGVALWTTLDGLPLPLMPLRACAMTGAQAGRGVCNQCKEQGECRLTRIALRAEPRGEEKITYTVCAGHCRQTICVDCLEAVADVAEPYAERVDFNSVTAALLARSWRAGSLACRGFTLPQAIGPRTYHTAGRLAAFPGETVLLADACPPTMLRMILDGVGLSLCCGACMWGVCV